MPIHQFAIGPKIYDLPYEEKADLVEMGKICAKLNTYVNKLIIQTGITDADVILVLACMNLMYEKDAPRDLFEKTDEDTFTESDVLSLLNIIGSKIKQSYDGH